MAIHEEVLDFINRRFSKDSDWCNGNCWWFATILLDRFKDAGAKRIYCQIEGHFVVQIDDKFYDWNGIYTPCKNEKPILWAQLCEDDPIYADRLIQYCKM